ncbi:hypothetical protein IMSAGC007_03183 [Lachnospiraceae bacterium]|nr:hypothetical protein IMSAGC007_03183 [Lachnospiraceae bacterium]
MRPLEFLLYVDEKYVESLYKYYYENVTEMTKRKTKNNNGRFSLGAKLFKSFPVDVSSAEEINLNNVTILENRIQPSIETKISCILNDKFKNKYIPLVNLINTISGNGIYYFQGVFELLALENKNGKDMIENGKYKNNPKGLVWKLRLVAYEENNKNVLMAMGGNNILVNYHHLTEEIEKYKRFCFNILGKISKLDDRNFTIKPIVIFYD